MIRSRPSNGQNADFIALSVNHFMSSSPMPKVRCKRGELGAQRDAAHEAVVGVDRDPEAEAAQEIDRMLLDRRRRAGVHVRGRAHLERDTPVAHVRGQAAERHPAVRSRGDVIDQVVVTAISIACCTAPR